MDTKLKTGENSLWRETGFKITKGSRANDIGVLFTFSDLNPETTVVQVLSKRDLLKLTWFFFSAIFTRRD